MHWLIEDAVFPATAPRIIAALEAHGHGWTRYEDGLPSTAFPQKDECLIFWGSLNAAYGERVASAWRPGAIGDPDQFRCSAYHPRLAALLANPGVVFTTARALVREPQLVLAPLGPVSHVFVRPDSALKPFSGRQLATSDLSLESLDHGFYYDDEDLPVAVSSAKQIGREWRFVVADGAVIAGCEYDPNRRGRSTDIPPSARALAEQVARHDWQPAPLYIADIGDVDGSLRVVELNPFSGADLYDCEADAIVLAVAQVASRLHGIG